MAIYGPANHQISPKRAARIALAEEIYMAIEAIGSDPITSAYDAGCDVYDITKAEADAMRVEFDRMGKKLMSKIKRGDI